MIRIMTIQGKANEEISTIRQPEDLTPAKRNTLFALQDQIIQIYTNLDPRLTFNVSNFRNAVALGYGGSFLLLHVWFHAVIITLHRPGLMFGKGALAHTLGKESLKVSMSSANTITTILGSAELIDDKTITGTPFLNQAIYIAGLAFIAESEMHGQHLATTLGNQIKEPLQNNESVPAQNFTSERVDMAFAVPTASTDPTHQVPLPATNTKQYNCPIFLGTFTQSFEPLPTAAPPPFQSTASNNLLQFASKRNYETCLNAITTLKSYWRGIGWILSTMEQKAKGIVQTDPSEESVDPEAEIDLRDAGMLQRLLAVKSSRRGKGKAMPTTVSYPAGLAADAGEAWEMGRNQASGTYGFAQNGFGIGDAWVNFAWLDSLAPNEGFANMRQENSQPDLQSGVWTLE
jgi:hypothetical protein